jgi:hypothetical protein
MNDMYDTRTAKQHRIARYAWVAFQVCVYSAAAVTLYFVLSLGT